MLRNGEGSSSTSANQESSYFSLFKQLVLGTSPTRGNIAPIISLNWVARLKKINYGNAFLKEEKEKNNNIDWAMTTTPCIPQLFCDPCDVNEDLISHPVMYSYYYRNVLNAEFVETLKDKNEDGVLIYCHTCFVHLRFTSLEKLQAAKIEVMKLKEKAEEELQLKCSEKDPNNPQIIKFKERLDTINQSIENYEAEKRIETYIHLFVEWYKCAYLEKNDFEQKSTDALMNELKKLIKNLKLNEETDLIEPQLYLQTEKIMQCLKQTNESIYPHQRETLCADIRKIQDLQPKTNKMSKTALTILKYVHEIEMSHQIEQFVSAQEIIAALEPSLNNDPKATDKLEELTAKETVKICTADYYAQKERDLRHLMDALETSCQILRGAIPLKNADDEEQTYFELEREVKLFNKCIEKISALSSLTKSDSPKSATPNPPKAVMMFTPDTQPSLTNILLPSPSEPRRSR